MPASGKLSEIEAAEQLAQFRRSNELFRDFSFDTISGAGPNGAIVHYRATPASNRRIQPGELYLVDSGAQYLDGTTDITRTVAIGAPTAQMRDHFTRVLKGHIALGAARFPRGTTGSQLDALARTALWAAGLDYDHGTGHGVGSYLGVHEGPHRISKIPNRVPLEVGMIVSNEPGFYKTGGYGIRIENLVTVVEAPVEGAERPMLGFETLTLAPIDRNLVDRGPADPGRDGLARRLPCPGGRHDRPPGRRRNREMAGGRHPAACPLTSGGNRCKLERLVRNPRSTSGGGWICYCHPCGR